MVAMYRAGTCPATGMRQAAYFAGQATVWGDGRARLMRLLAQ